VSENETCGNISEIVDKLMIPTSVAASLKFEFELANRLHNGIASFGENEDTRALTALIPYKYPVLASLIAKYPRASGCLFQAYNDIVYGELAPLLKWMFSK